MGKKASRRYRIEEAYRLAVEKLRGIYDKDSDYYSELEWSIRPDDPAVGNGGGYVIDSFRSVRMVMQYDTFEMTLKKAVSLGNDTDTTAAIAAVWQVYTMDLIIYPKDGLMN
jgi:ADP-ribosylglycohydrolase